MALASLAMMAAGTAVSAYGSIQEGKEYNRQAEEAARERMREASIIQGIGQEEQFDLAREKGMAVGAHRARAAKAGVGGPSVQTQTNRIRAEYNRKQALKGRKTMYQVGSLHREAQEWKRRGLYAKRASYWGAGESLLSGAAMMGKTFKYKKTKGLRFRT